jgi:voltage-gated potassium channel Kch
MPHETPLIATIVAGLGLAFIFGALANRFRVPPLVGYLIAGVLVGPNTPGFVADQNLALELAEIGVILLMFGVGLHFSLKDLLSVRAIAIPGAVVQIGFATALGAAKGEVFASANAAGAKRLILAIPNAFEAGQIILRARAANPAIAIIARAHSDAEVEHLKELGADTVIMGEREIARGIVEQVLEGDVEPPLAGEEPATPCSAATQQNASIWIRGL